MGLDMYLTATEYISRFDYSEKPDGGIDRKENALFEKIVSDFEMADKIDEHGFAGLEIEFPMGYWRKANQIHQWFVDNIGEGEDNCQKMFVPKSALETLKSTCLEVIADIDKANDLLPTSSGCFFGSTEIDQYYIQHLLDTIKIIDRCLSSQHDYFTYQASW